MKRQRERVKRIKIDPLERRDPTLKEKWNQFFQELEDSLKKEYDKFPADIHLKQDLAYQSMAAKLNLPTEEPTVVYRTTESTETCFSGLVNPFQDSVPLIDHDVAIEDNFQPSELSCILSSNCYTEELCTSSEEFINENEDNYETMLYDSSDLSVEFDEDDLKRRDETEKKTHELNPYQIFLRLPKKKAAKWRPPEESTMEELNAMSLPQKAAHIENRVAANFCNWFHGLGGIEINLTEQTLKELFEIGMVNPASHSICTNIAERAAIPEGIAIARDLREKSFRHILKEHLLWNVRAENKASLTKAFGRSMPATESYQPPKNNTYKNWLSCSTVSKELETFSVAFSDILHLRSVDAYCRYIVKQSVHRRPYFLEKKDIFKKLEREMDTSSLQSRSGQSILKTYTPEQNSITGSNIS